MQNLSGKFDGGWDQYRTEAFERQKKLGVIPANAKLTERSAGLPAWDSLVPDQKRLYARMMEVFAAYGAHVDHHMGRVIEAVKQLPGADNTLFIYIAGDNGSSAEGGLEGSINENLFFNGLPENWEDNLEAIDELGGREYFNHFPSAWAHAMNTPFQWTKQVASHFGGTRNPMIVSWPAKIKDQGEVRSQFTHVIDLIPTIYDACGVTAPRELNGVVQKPIEGNSFYQSLLQSDASETRRKQYFELASNRGIYQDGWMASAIAFEPWQSNRTGFDPDKQEWELYDITEDFTQSNNLAKQNPDKLRQLQDLWWVEAAKYSVLPLDWRATERFNSEKMGRPTLGGDASRLTYYPGQIGLPDAASPRTLNKSWTITAKLTLPDAASGMVVTQGGLMGGYGLYFKDGKPSFVYNMLSLQRPTITAEQPLPAGDVALSLDFDYQGEENEVGKAATVTLSADGVVLAKGEIDRTIPAQYGLGEGLDIGMDIGSPVDFTYELPFEFNGQIEQVTFDLQ